MGIHHIAGIAVNGCDPGLCLLLGRIVAIEIMQLRSHAVGDLIAALAGQLCHERTDSLRILPCDLIDQALQVAGDQDIHGRGRRQHLSLIHI